MTTPDQSTLDHLPNFCNNAYSELYEARPLITVAEKSGFLLGNQHEAEEPMHPTDVAFLMAVVLDLIKEAFEHLDELGSFLNAIRLNRGHSGEEPSVWAGRRRLWARGDPADRALILRCAKVLDGRPHLRADLQRLLPKLEEGIRPEPYLFFAARPIAGDDMAEPDA